MGIGAGATAAAAATGDSASQVPNVLMSLGGGLSAVGAYNPKKSQDQGS